jgi:hypothetical protein
LVKQNEDYGSHWQSYIPEIIMVKIELARVHDINDVEELHRKFYSDAFGKPDFKHYLSSFVARDEKQELVLFGGARLIVEVVAMTNKTASARKKHDALYKFLDSVEDVSRTRGFDQIHAFPELDATWRERLQRDGFRPTKYPAYVKDI